jgi:hypothetical protein
MLIVFGERQGMLVHLVAGRQLPLGEHLPVARSPGSVPQHRPVPQQTVNCLILLVHLVRFERGTFALARSDGALAPAAGEGRRTAWRPLTTALARPGYGEIMTAE